MNRHCWRCRRVQRAFDVDLGIRRCAGGSRRVIEERAVEREERKGSDGQDGDDCEDEHGRAAIGCIAALGRGVNMRISHDEWGEKNKILPYVTGELHGSYKEIGGAGDTKNTQWVLRATSGSGYNFSIGHLLSDYKTGAPEAEAVRD